MLPLWVGLDTVISSGPADWRPLVSWVIARGVGIIVLTVAVLDYRSIDRDYQQFASALAISGLKPTYWRPVPESPLASAREYDGEGALRRAWSLNRGLLQVPSDALVPRTPWDSSVRGSEVFTSASLLVPEWSSPWMRQAYVGWRQTMVRCHLSDAVAGNLGPDMRARRIQALANAQVATQLNPLDPGSIYQFVSPAMMPRASGLTRLSPPHKRIDSVSARRANGLPTGHESRNRTVGGLGCGGICDSRPSVSCQVRHQLTKGKADGNARERPVQTTQQWLPAPGAFIYGWWGLIRSALPGVGHGADCPLPRKAERSRNCARTCSLRLPGAAPGTLRHRGPSC